MTCSKDTVKATGLNIWASGRENRDESEIDVIAVHGLGAHPYYTWVRKQDPVEEIQARRRRLHDLLRGRQNNTQVDKTHNVTQTPSNAAEEIMWLRDVLPDFIPNARIATYSYESDWRKRDIKTSLRQCGEQLLNVLHQNRLSEKESRRPLVFIGHSLGGLVIKQALVLANHGDDFKDIRLSTAGIIFLGTPHQGSNAAVYGMWLAQAARYDKTLLESLKKSSAVLHDIARDFETSYRSVDVVCFYENKEASYGPWRTQFVDHQSASLHGRRMMYLTTDHSGLNKFGGVEDENFALVLPEIQNMIQRAPQKVEEQYRSHAVISEKESFRVDFSLRGIPVMNRFVAREAEMSRIKQVLLPTSTDQMRRKVFILHGLGGIGKTQLSVAFAREHRESYSAVFWIDGSTKERLRRNIADLASRLPQDQISETSRSYSQKKGTDVDEVVQDILKWLSRRSNNRWLLIFDNIDREFSISSRDPEAFDVREYFPAADQGSILITSRLASLQQLGVDVKLTPVDEQQGKSILENSLGRSAEDSAELVKLLQGLPLAINQAGSYMRETGTNISQYIRLYDQAWGRLIEKQNQFNQQVDKDRSVLTTWTVSFSHLKTRSEDAAKLLMLWAFLDNQDLWYELLSPTLDLKIANDVPGWFTKCVGDELDFQE
ncbi:hypothetical protein MMC14_010278, partial [Varicellaria rhodocarpa]|nr:hypothetical protein [Varicellaria rhodocarpa]